MISTERTPQRQAHSAEHARLGVDSEVGVLRRVILHRPGRELERLTPTNKDELLFDDVLWVKRARQEHDAFTYTLRARGVTVLHLQDLLAQTLEDSEVCERLVRGTIAHAALGKRLGGARPRLALAVAGRRRGRRSHRRRELRRPAVHLGGPRHPDGRR